MKKLFNIFCWNIHNKDCSNNLEKINKATHIIKSVFESGKTYNNIKSERIKSIEDIDAVILSESYPQIKENSNELNNFLQDTHKFKIYHNDGEKNCITIFLKNEYIVKEENIKKETENTDFCIIRIEKLNICLAGIRIHNAGGHLPYDEQIEIITSTILNITKGDDKVIIIGDFNPGNRENKEIEEIIENGKVSGHFYDRDETRVSPKPSENSLVSNYTDKLFLSGTINCKGLEKVLTPEQIYCDEKFLDDKGHIKNELIVYNGRSCGFNREVKDLYKTEFANYDIGLNYKNPGLCNAPFPDHNLLFASIDLGD